MLAARAWRVAPLLILLVLYWPGLTNWFYQDDFGWLNLRHDVHSFGGLGAALFAPKAHGNIRPLGENAYFLVLSSLFGVDALPFRICAFATQIASLLLLGSIVARLAASRAAGFWAQILWITNSGLAAAMCWTSIYNQILSGFFFLLALYFFQRRIESGGTRYRAAHWLAFVLGLGALETNVVYPAIAAVYALLFARPYLKKVLPMFLISALAVAAHFWFAPPPHDGVYAPHLNGRMLATLWTYWTWALGPSRPAMALLTCAVLALVAWQARMRQWAGLFGLAWFVIVLSPYLPLSDHKMDYYLAVPSVGLAIAGGWAIARAPWKIAALVCAAVYLGTTAPAAWTIAKWNHDRGARVEDLVLGVAEIHAAQPGKLILLDGIDSDLFWSGIVDLPFRAMEIPHVYLAPESEARIQAPADLTVKYVLPQALTLPALQDGRAVVYQVEGSQDGATLRNATARYRAAAESLWKPSTPRFINLGDSVYAGYVGSGWDDCADGYRMLRRAGVVRIASPRSPTGRLYIGVFRTTDFPLGVRVDNLDVPVRIVQRGGELTELSAPLPANLTPRPEIQVTLANGGAEPLRFGYLDVR
ncbi:MAG TPA: hypothetical protein VKR61_08505 [Bryobacteraceae bacterium]|nr:hypothetical protein [Bryobacteraceae bacterium]